MSVQEMCDGHDYGIIRPGLGNRWQWPFTAMEPGDYFHVDHAQRTSKEVRRIAAVRMSQEDKYVSIVKDSPLMAGHTLVVCTPPPNERRSDLKQSVAIDYAGAQARIDQWYYGIDLSRVAGPRLENFEKVFEPAQKYAEPVQDRLVFTMAKWTIGATMLADGVEFKRLPDRATPQQWETLDAQWDSERERWALEQREARQREDDLRHGVAPRDTLSDAMG